MKQYVQLMLKGERKDHSVRRAKMVSTSSFLLGAALLGLVSCAHHQDKNTDPAGTTAMVEYQKGAVVWFQNAGEARALQYMAYNTATARLKEALALAHKKKGKAKGKDHKGLAVVLDIDETVLDNSAFQAHNLQEHKNYPTGWKEWVLKERARSIAGAREFLQFAHFQGVEIFYITNRKKEEEKATFNNLVSLGLPATLEHVMGRTGTSSKKDRRDLVAKDHKIVLLIGDNLNDLSEDFEDKSVEDRFSQVDRHREEFGASWIVLPNPMYGDWEGAVYGNDWKKSDAQKEVDRNKSLKTYGY